MSLTDQLTHPIDAIVAFAKPYFPDATREELTDIIAKHWMYGTIDTLERNGKIIAAVRWNVSETGTIFEVLDLFILPGERGLLLMKNLIARNWHRFPTAQYIYFARSRKYGTRRERLYKITDMLHLKEAR